MNPSSDLFGDIAPQPHRRGARPSRVRRAARADPARDRGVRRRRRSARRHDDDPAEGGSARSRRPRADCGLTCVTAPLMTDLVVIFRTPSQIEADVVRGLLETHGIADDRVVATCRARRFPSPSTSCAIAVQAEERDAREADHRQPSRGSGPGPRRALRLGARAARAAHRLSLQGSRAAGARADAPLARARGCERRRVRQRVDGVPRRLGAGLRRSPTCCSAQFPQHNEGQKSKLKASIVSAAVAGAARREDRARRVPDPRPRRGEDRRPPQARAHRRLLRGADCRDLSRRRHRAGARVHRAAVRRSHRRGAAHRRARGVYRGLQVGVAGMAAVARPRPACRTVWRRRSARRTGGCSTSRSW